MGKKKNFDKKTAVRFQLANGIDKDGKATVLYKPVENTNSRLTKKQKRNIIQEIGDYDEITINGKVVDQSEIPSYVLDQIRGRTDLLYNQIKGKEMLEKEHEEGDLYDIQDAEADEDYEDYDQESLDEDQENIIQEVGEDQWEDQGSFDEEDLQMEEENQNQHKQEQKAFKKKAFRIEKQEFPTIQQEKTQLIEFEGKTYELTEMQAKLLETVIPENYDELNFGVKFKKFNEDGLLLSQKDKYGKYYLDESLKKAIVDSYEFVPAKPTPIYDNDLKPNQIHGDVKQIEDALDYQGEEEVYQELEDDFFAKLIQLEQKTNPIPKENKIAKPIKELKKDQTNIINEKTQQVKSNTIQMTKQDIKISKYDMIEDDGPLNNNEINEEQLEKALYNFQNNIEETNNNKKVADEDDSEDEQENDLSGYQGELNYKDIENRQEYKGRDGELDWRYLSKKQKKQYMKTKVIRENYDELRERQIEEKLKGKRNITAEELHLKELIKHIPFEQDHVMQSSLEDDLQVKVVQEDLDSETDSSDDDIVSYHQRTSIISSNLAMVEEPRKKKHNKHHHQQTVESPSFDPSILKFVPEKRDKNQTKEQRKIRKDKLRDMKKQKKQIKQEFAEKFDKERKTMMKKENPQNTLHKVSYVKIY